MTAPAVKLIEATRRFGEVAALSSVNLSVPPGEFFSLLGPSGCGKTTLLRLIAGLDLPDSGTVRIDGQDATRTPAHLRPVNTVFQSYALFPHLTARDNIAFGLRMKKIPAAQIAERVARVVETVQITGWVDRKPHQLSGGQKQRVALARALVNEPRVLLLDEPMGALDLKLRKQLQIELRALQRRLGLTFIYVTHDQEEALAMSDRIAVMNLGRIEQCGAANEIYERPRSRFVAEFLGSCNVLDATLHRHGPGAAWMQTSLGELQVNVNGVGSSVPSGSGAACALAIRPEKVQLLATAPANQPNCIKARLAGITYHGSENQYRFTTSAGPLQARRLNAAHDPLEIQVGQEVFIQLPPSALIVLEN